MNLLDRYVFKSVLFACATAVALFTFIFTVANFTRDLLPYVLSGQLPYLVLAKLVLLLLPFAITYALPMGMLTGVLLTLGRLSADSEITAMRAVGIGVARVSRPIFVLAALGVALGLYFDFDSMPRARVQYHEEFAEAVRANPLSFIVPKTFIRDFPGCVVYVNEKEGGVIRDLSIWVLDSDRRVKQFVRAASGSIRYDEAANSLYLTVTHAQVATRSDQDPEDFSESGLVVSAKEWGPIQLPLDRFFGRTGAVHIKQEWLTWPKLQAERARLAALPVPADRAKAKEAARNRMKLELIYQDKFNTALAVFSLTLVGVPLGIRVSRRETSANFVMALLVTLGYYLLTVAVKVLDRHPEYRPDLLLWVPNFLLIGLGAWLFTRIERK